MATTVGSPADANGHDARTSISKKIVCYSTF
jgi:hypothetical protein